GSRYFFETQNSVISGTPKMTFVAEMFKTSDGKPVSPALGSISSSNLDTLTNGFWFDAPSGSEDDQTFYLHIAGSGGLSSTVTTFTLRAHEAPSSPAEGTITNPAWTGAATGKWTMDLDKALAASAKDGKPVLLYFSGVRWCPHCAGWEQTSFSTTAFGTRSKNYYLVCLDNRRRNGSGPSLLLDNQKNGYCYSHGITDSAAAEKLAENRLVEEALSGGLSATTDYPNGRIAYPTFLLCQGTSATRSDVSWPGLEVIARTQFYAWTGEADVNAAFDQFDALAAAGYREVESSPNDDNPNVLVSGFPVQTSLGGMVSEYWGSFTVTEDYGWEFTLSALDPAEVAGATIAISVYAEDGTTRLINVSASDLSKGFSAFYPPDAGVSGKHWVCVSVLNNSLNTLQAFVLLGTERYLLPEISMGSADVYVYKTAKAVPVPLKMTTYRDVNAVLPLTLQVAADNQDVAQWIEEGDASVDWPTLASHSATFLIDLDYQGTSSWTGVDDRTFTVTIAEIEDDEYYVSEPSQTIVHILSQPTFQPNVQTAYTLYQGLHSEVMIPYYADDNASFSFNGTLPSGLSLNSVETEYGRGVVLSGVATSTTTDAQRITLRLASGNKVTSLPITVKVENPSSEALATSAFSGALHLSDSPDGQVDGSLFVRKNDDSTLDIMVVTADAAKPLTCTLPGWSGYSPEDNTISLTASYGENGTLLLAVSNDGSGTGAFISALGNSYDVVVNPVTTVGSEYKGQYNVALRPKGDVIGDSMGWLTLDVQDNGLVSYDMQLYDGSQATGIACCLYDDATTSMGVMTVYVPLYWEEESQCYTGFYSGELLIVPESRRSKDEADAWVSGCTDYASTWVDADGLTNTVEPCGSLYDPSRRLQDIVLSDTPGFYTFYATLPMTTGQNGVSLAPTPLTLQENEAGDTFSVASAGFLAAKMGALSIDRSKGMFTGTMTVFTGENQALLDEFEVSVQGIITPVSETCCTASDAVAVGYGFYSLNGMGYPIRILPGVVAVTGTPEVYWERSQDETATWSIYAGSRQVLYRRQDDGRLGFIDCTGHANPFQVTLPAETAYRIEALDLRNQTLESPFVSIISMLLEERAFTAPPSQGTAHGWKMLGIPHDLLVISQLDASQPCYTIDPLTNSMVLTDELEGGRSYWMFAPDGTASLTVLCIQTGDSWQPDLSLGWNMVTWDKDCPEQSGVTFFVWDGNDYEATDAPDEGEPVLLHWSAE
ncbi:MAG: thioredoxin family protein, partial [Victivallales bacterium]|nr:thioredoxin family protein [Victivallales bacterium]